MSGLRRSKQGWGTRMCPQGESDPAAVLIDSVPTSGVCCKPQFKPFPSPGEVLGIPACTRIYINPMHSVFGRTQHPEAQGEEVQQDAAGATRVVTAFLLSPALTLFLT